MNRESIQRTATRTAEPGRSHEPHFSARVSDFRRAQWGVGRRGQARALGRGPEHDRYYVSGFGQESFADIDLPGLSLITTALLPIALFIFALVLSLWDSKAVAGSYIILGVVVSAVSVPVFKGVHLYREADRYPGCMAFSDILMRWLFLAAAVSLLSYGTGYQRFFSAETLIMGCVFAPFVLFGTHALARKALRNFILSKPARIAVILGDNPLSRALGARIERDGFLNVDIAGFFDDRQTARSPDASQPRRLGSLAEVADYVKKNSVSIIYLCLPIMWQARILALLNDLRDTTASVYYVPDVFVSDLIQARIDRVGGMPTIALCESPFIGIRGLIKRLTDVGISVAVLLVIWPVLCLIAIGVKLSSPGPAIYKQLRYGLDGKEIMVFKFRTMRVCEDSHGVVQAREGDDRVTKFGGFLRRTSLDELPQLINVLGGSMSLVGPRPHAVVHNEVYRKVIDGYMVRHKVKPGITGWAQVNGLRGETDTLDKMKARVELDLEYLRTWSLTLDMAIIVRSIGVVFGDAKAY